VTLVGPGGVGKTRLATEAALTVPDEWPDGVWLVELAPVRRADLVDAAVASVLGVADSDATSWLDGVLGHLARRRLLLVLDNCEHLPAAVAELIDAVLSHCEHVGVLATSRAPVGIRSERVHRIGPLAVTDGPDGTARTGTGGGPAIELFEARAGPVPAARRGDVAELCRELDGLPLAIELAAARAHTVPPGELVARLRRFPASRATAFESSDPGLPERHRSLARVLDWSIERLDPDQRVVLRRLTVFVSGFDLDAALRVCATADLGESDVADHLWSLVDGSLVEIDPGAGETRYRLLATVRAHLEAGADGADLDGAKMRLASHLRRELGPERELDLRWIHRMEVEIDNVRAIVDHPATPVDVAQSLAWAVGKFHDVTDDFRTGITELGRWVEQLTTDGPELVAMLTLLADLHLRLADLDAAGRLLERAEDVATTSGSAEWDTAGLTRARADLAIRLGDAAGAVAALEAELRHRHPPRAAARLWDTLAIARAMAGDVAGAMAALESELAAATASGTEALLATTHGNLAEANLQLGDRRAAAHHQLISLELARAYRHPVEVAFSMMIAARLIASPERHDDAVRLQVVADELLAEAAYQLYADDHLVRGELLDAARAALGPQEFDRIATEARATDPDEAVELAARVLADIATPVAATTTADHDHHDHHDPPPPPPPPPAGPPTRPRP
jgi:predicted ATPase